MKEASKRRIKVMEEIVGIVKQATSREEAVEQVKRYLVEEGLEEDDADLLVDEALRRLGYK